ncbi:hypothetical protein D7Y13_23380 [Corallococcus praedator]|uniref:Uncharacterized protein n=1 Tax=Corallococcus praedator TaxID=2316724 RepID=A0ABX9QFR9_9BACT|nr:MULTISPECIES: hypothetical protein [Corallococcus]RKH25677.1 hypothetical protein D7X75_29620 [Corallococcus sp. CA031C]RKI02942.1 hypothetical protein D7Y13_23380 [Corallococcus praedator]
MLLSSNEFLPRAEATLAGLKGPVSAALSHHGEPSVSSLAREFPKDAPLSPSALVQALCPGPLSPIGFAAVVMREVLPRVDAVLDASVAEPTVVTGNARASGGLRVTAPLVVLGDLEVEGVLEDCGPDSTVVVVGCCTAWGLKTSGNFLVLGDLVVRDVIQGIYNDDSLVVAGDLTTRFLDENDHDVSSYGEVHAEHHFENGRSGEEAASLASTFLVPELWNLDLGELHHDDLFERIQRGEPVFTATPQPQQRREPDAPTAEELEGLDVEGIAARASKQARAKDVVYAQRRTGEVWLLRPGSFPMHIFDGQRFLGEGPPPALDVKQRASERVTFWRKRGDLFLEIERFGAVIQLHVGINNGSLKTFRFAFETSDAAASEVRRLEARYTGDFLRVTSVIPGRGPLEREFAHYGGPKAEYTSAIVDGTTLVTRDGERHPFEDEAAALSALEDWIAAKRQAGFDLKILEWKPFGLLGRR